jgi:hypothetical protein
VRWTDTLRWEAWRGSCARRSPARRHDGAGAFRLAPATITLAEVVATLVGALIADLISAAIARYQHHLYGTATKA